MIVDLFAGAGGWDVALRHLHALDAVGYEHDHDACKTRRAAGMPTVEGDLTHQPVPTHLEGLIASPPCQSFSTAGKRLGLDDARGALVWEPLRWLTACPRWVAFEQVPEVLPIWRDYARQLTADGYSTWCGLLDAERYGVPQTRRRAILIAHRDRPVAPPEPTHQRYDHDVPRGDPHACGADNLFDAGVKPWVSMADALGWTDEARVGFPRRDDRGDSPDGYRERDWRSASEPWFAITEKARSWTVHRPATTVTTDSRIATPGHHDADTRSFGDGSVRLTVAQAAALQTFPPDHPWQGTTTSQHRQIGNAIPPRLARHILNQLTAPY